MLPAPGILPWKPDSVSGSEVGGFITALQGIAMAFPRCGWDERYLQGAGNGPETMVLAANTPNLGLGGWRWSAASTNCRPLNRIPITSPTPFDPGRIAGCSLWATMHPCMAR